MQSANIINIGIFIYCFRDFYESLRVNKVKGRTAKIDIPHITVYPRKIGSRVWAYVVKRVVARFCWNFYTIIWHLYALIFADWKFFLTISGFFRAAKRKNKAVFRISLKMANFNEIFYVMKFIGKIHLGYFLNGRIVIFHFRLILEFSD